MSLRAWRLIICLVIMVYIGTEGAVRSSAQSTEVEFHVYDSAGNPVRWEAFRSTQENGKGEEGDNDKLLDSDDLTVIKKRENETYGLYSSLQGPNERNGNPTIEWPRGRTTVALTLAWPTAEGYSNLMLDLPLPSATPAPVYPASSLPIYTLQAGKSVAIFNLLAAQRVVDSLEKARTGRAAAPFSFPYIPSAEYREAYIAAYNSAGDNLRRAKSDGLTESERGSLGQKAFEAATKATLLMLEDYGVQYARAMRAAFKPKWGVTLEGSIQQPGGPDAPIKEATFDSIRALVNCSEGDGWVRLIISPDEGITPEYYYPAIRWAHSRGLKVVAALLDSFDMCCINREKWKAHVRRYVDALSNNQRDRNLEVDVWEVGNEVNGSWLVEKSEDEDRCRSCTGYAATADFISYAAHYVKTKTTKRTMLTLFWQIGEDDPDSAMFNWLRDKLMRATAPDGKSVLIYLDNIGISLYPDKSPMGIAFDRVFSTLRNKYFTLPQHHLMITELDYWPLRAEPGYTHFWRWGERELSESSSEAEFQKVRSQVARLYQSAMLGYPYSDGGTFWWYYLQEVAPASGYIDNEIWKTLNSIHSKVVGPDVKCLPRLR